MSDSAASKYVCRDDRPNSTLVDATYPPRSEFIKSDGSPQHAANRSVVERYFGRLKALWKLVGTKYGRDPRWHSLVIRAAFILTNMVITWNAGLNH